MKLIAISQLLARYGELAAKTLLVMKLTTFMILAFTLHVSAKSFSQRVTVKGKDISLFKVFDLIETQTGYSFVYDEKPLAEVPLLTLDCKNVSIPEVMDILLKGTGFEYVTINKSIVIRPHFFLMEKKMDRAEVEDPQSITVSGKITDEKGRGLAGVNISVKNSNTGTVSGDKGEYRISVPNANSVLVFTSVGFEPQERKAPAGGVLNIILKEQVIDLNEMVVVGYGRVKKKDLTGAVGSLQSGDIVRSNPVSASKALQGQVAGVVVQKSNNQPGQEFSIDIRGQNTINNSTEPLVVIDGLIGGRLRDINPNDIKTIDVLKDASSTAIYGSRGANGVVIVTTKKGVSGKAKVTVDSYLGYKKPAHLPRLLNAQEYKRIFVDELAAAGGTPRAFTANEKAVVESGKSVDWVDEITKPGLQTSNTIAVSGGSQNTTYRFSGGYLQEDGNLLHTNYKRYNLNAGLDSRINKFLKVGFTGYLNYSTQATGSRESLRSAYRARPTGTIFYDDLTNPTDGFDAAIEPYKGYAIWMGVADTQVMNPIVEADPENTQYQVNISNLMGNAYIEIEPVKGLTFRSSVSASVIGEKQGDYRGTYSKDRAGTQKPKAQYDTRDWGNYTIDNILTYNYTNKNHRFTVTALQSAFKERAETYTIAVEDLPYASLWYNLGTASKITKVASHMDERTLTSYMGRINYGFMDKYLLTLTGRSDGASQLAEGNKWAFFPSAAIAWRMSEEKFVKNAGIFSDLKFRLSYGEVGNSTVKPYSTQASILNTAYDFNGAPAYGFAPENLANKKLKWERSREFNFGLDMGFFNNRISASVEVYNRKTIDLIFEQKVPTSSGYSSVNTNIGQIGNKGVEVSLNTINIAKTNFGWSTNFTFAANSNKILRLYGDNNTEDKGNKLFVGYSVKSNYYYEFAGIWQTDEAAEAAIYKQVPGSVKVVDQNGDKKILSSDDKSLEDRVVLGSQLPKFTLGITNRFNYKAFDLSLFIYYRNGAQFNNSMLSGTMGDYANNRYNHLKLNYWTKDNPTNDYYGLAVAQPYKEAIFYQNADFIRISDITFGYTLPKAKVTRLGINALRVYAQVSNPFVFTKFDGMDPEYNSSAYIDDVPNVLFAAGVSVTF